VNLSLAIKNDGAVGDKIQFDCTVIESEKEVANPSNDSSDLELSDIAS
jgi:hypothetical protein